MEDGHLTKLLKSLNDREVLIRLNTFLLLYFGWIGFTILYGHIKSHSRDVSYLLLRLPFTSRNFVLGVLSFTREHAVLYYLMKLVYYIGFSGSIAMTVFLILLYFKDLKVSDELALSYLLTYAICGVIYSIVHVYAPHYVYRIPGFYPDNTWLTQQEFVLPSLHNTVASINILALWKYRKTLTGKLTITLNSLVPFSTFLLGHHWIYDALIGILLAICVWRISQGRSIHVPKVLKNIHVSRIKAATIAGFLAGGVILIMALTIPKP